MFKWLYEKLTGVFRSKEPEPAKPVAPVATKKPRKAAPKKSAPKKSSKKSS